MPRRRPVQGPTPTGLRAALVAYSREQAEHYRRRGMLRVGDFGCPWPAMVAALEAGEPVTVYGWQIITAIGLEAPPPGVVAQRRYRLAGDVLVGPL